MRKIALAGNPNTGKSSLFNRLTGLKQHVGNFPGVTVDKKVGTIQLEGQSIELIDLPGTYSIYPRSMDEQVVYDVLQKKDHPDYPDAVFVVVDASNLERNLLLFTQIYDLGIPTGLILNMSDMARRKGKKIQLDQLKNRFPGIPILETNARIGIGMKELKQALFQEITYEQKPIIPSYTLFAVSDQDNQAKETEQRFAFIRSLMKEVVLDDSANLEKKSPLLWLDKLLVHPLAGYGIFAAILLLLFQLIFSIASVPMDLIDSVFAQWSDWTAQKLPEGVFSDLITQGIIPGLGGVVIFVPQIALLFFFLGVLEETGYMARVVFIMDRLMRPFGLNGKSVVPLISSAACAIPGVMAARTISNWKERLITILVAPLMSCSARIPVYTLLIALVIPNKQVFGFLNLQGLTLFGLYALGLISALLVSAVMRMFIKTSEKSLLMLELPEFRSPRWGNVFLNLFEKVKIFVLDAGKIILAISIVLWALASYGPGDRMEKAVSQVTMTPEMTTEEFDEQVASAKLENSYIGIIGKGIEPAIQPLGYDWKIGISLITSFAAREVFVGSMATIYSVHDDGDTNEGLLNKMRAEKRTDGSPVYSLATGLSLMVFYVYAMQCMATLAIVKRETKSWKWPLIQVGYMGVLAYIASWITYQLFQ